MNNWSTILNNAKTAADIIAILRNVLAQLDSKSFSQIEELFKQTDLNAQQKLDALQALYNSAEATTQAEISNLQQSIQIAAAAGAGANGWTALVVQDASGKNQQEINDSNKARFSNDIFLTEMPSYNAALADVSAPLQEAIDLQFSSRTTSNAFSQGNATCPRVVIPKGVWKANVVIYAYTEITGVNAVLQPFDLTKPIIDTIEAHGTDKRAYVNKFENLSFQKGEIHVRLYSRNIGGGAVEFNSCRFDDATNVSSYIKCQSSNIVYNDCEWFGNTREIYNERCDHLVLNNPSIKRGTLSTNKDAGIINYGKLTINDLFGNPQAPIAGTKETAWINNYYNPTLVTDGGRSGLVLLDNCRFGGESGQCTIVNNFAKGAVSAAGVPQNGVTIVNSDLYCIDANGITTLTGVISASSASATVTGTGTLFLTEVSVGSRLTSGGVEVGIVSEVISNTELKVNTNSASVSNVSATVANSCAVRLFAVPNNIWVAANNGLINATAISYGIGADTTYNEQYTSLTVNNAAQAQTGGGMNVRGGAFAPAGLEAVDTKNTRTYNFTSSGRLKNGQQNSNLTNLGATATVFLNILQAKKGRFLNFYRLSDFDVILTPFSGDQVRGSAVNKSIRLINTNAKVMLYCVMDGIWEVINNKDFKLDLTGELISYPRVTSQAFNAVTIPANSFVSSSYTVSNIALGDYVKAVLNRAHAGIIVSSEVDAANTVTVYMQNTTSTPVNIAAGAINFYQ